MKKESRELTAQIESLKERIEGLKEGKISAEKEIQEMYESIKDFRVSDNKTNEVMNCMTKRKADIKSIESDMKRKAKSIKSREDKIKLLEK